MPFAQKLLLYVPVVPLTILVIIAAAGLSMLGLFIVWRFIPRKILKMHNELTGAIFGAVALAYTVLLAFVVVVSWQNFDKAKSYVELEANCLVSLHRSSAAFSAPFKDEVRAQIKDYAGIVVNKEWQMLARGQESMEAREALRKIWDLYTGYEPKTEKEKAFFSQSISKLYGLREARRLRIMASRTGVQPIMWFILSVGAIATISFTFFFGSDIFSTHVVMASILAVLIALILLAVLLFEFPFTGGVKIEPEVFREIINF
ncbi:DUF4239 domain-containing protein [bacterium]|nr:MAG: DUF4239 domain-containing protein [bacterium]